MGATVHKWHKLPVSTDYAAEKARQRASSLKLLLVVGCLVIVYNGSTLLQPGLPNQPYTAAAGSRTSTREASAAGAAVDLTSDRAQKLQAAGAEQAQGASVEVPPAAAAPADHFNSTRCPAWLTEYEEWHVKNRNAPGAKYLFADAPGFVGVGDHLRGYMYALRLASGSKRVLLLRWDSPGKLTDFLLPGSRIDWTWQGTPAAALIAEDPTLKRNTTDKDVYTNNAIGMAFPNATFFSHDPSNKTFLVIKTNFPAGQKCLMCPPAMETGVVRLRDYDHVCMFRYLFKPSPLVEQKTDEYLQTLYPSYSTSNRLAYQAVHLRLGQMQGEASVINRVGYGDPLAMFLLSVSCGKSLGSLHGLDSRTQPQVLLADHKGVRQFSQHGGLADVVAPSYQAVHTKLNSPEAHLLSFVDLNILARAKCVVLSLSGFSNVAWWMSGGNPCMLLLSDCYEKCANKTQPHAPISCPLS